MTSSQLNIEIVGSKISLLGEGPVWDAKQGMIYWIDILNGQLHSHHPSTNTELSIGLDQMIGSFALSENGKIIAALKEGIYWVDKITGQKELIIAPEKHLPNNRFNDGKCDPAGRFWAGTMSLTEEKEAGSLYCIEKNKQTGLIESKKMISDLTISNGMAWSRDGKTFYFIDTPTYEIVSYDYDFATGSIENKKIIVRVDAADGFPDGMTMDAEGMLWVAHWGGWQVTRWNPLTGKKLSSIKLPAAKITSCTFGGDNLTDFYISSARVGLTDAELAQQPLAGSLFVVKNCGYKGLPAVEFKG
jgi:sugar lactone lactonase YvrE